MRASVIARYFVYCRHNPARRRLMHHVTCARDAVKRALDNVAMKAGRLLIYVDQTVLLAGDDSNGHLQVRVFVPEVESVGNHERGFGG